jgi:hypothetical protein
MSKRPFDGGVGVGGARKQRIDLSDLKPAGNGGGLAGPGTVNPYTNRQYSSRYYDILSKRRGLPVYEFLDELLTKVKKNQVCEGGWVGWGGWCVEREGGEGRGRRVGLPAFYIGPYRVILEHIVRLQPVATPLKHRPYPSFPPSLPYLPLSPPHR